MSNHTAAPTATQDHPGRLSGTYRETNPPGGSGPADGTTGRWWTSVKVMGIPLVYFAALFLLLTVAAVTDHLPPSMLIGFTVTMVIAGALTKIGDSLPVLRDFGLPIILCLIVPAILVQVGVMPESVVTVIDTFVEDQGFTDFVIMGVIAGAILGMPRKLLIKAGLRYLLPVAGTVVLVFLAVGAIGAAIGFGFVKAILFVAGPIMAGGLPLGALPMSDMYAAQTGGNAADFLSELMSVVIFANLLCVFLAAILNGIGKRGAKPFVGFNGNGDLLRVHDTNGDLVQEEKVYSARFVHMAQGLVLAGIILLAGMLLNALIPSLHHYAWAVIIAAAVKILGLLPKELEEASSAWSELTMSAFVPALVVALSTSIIDIDGVLAALSNPTLLLMTVATVVFAAVVSGILGYFMKFYFIEACLLPGLVMADTGGSGDVAVLSAAERMNLIPFATIATRLGGVLVLFVTSLMVPFLSSGMV
ncbi:2-hydroxycarboxylate transporter family protein [Citricoccus sp.]|uniref:2-hydroxycarboxylate transporter family protein n=1 Tax=Citricoccus sp. TaxID=1978372 RepID=UPI0028BD83B7|nr:2-hydroxycarboxylate transporter family protein [Citricoccus sp.]